tara:strand:+ start:362 stop:616 length:255 start_codon:yes stop_codon:yes gene_type:complete
MTPTEQLDLWVRGISTHNNDRGECCPDFSCCKPELLAPVEVRETFANASEPTRHGMLGSFLGKAIALLTDQSTYIAGQDVEDMV